MNFACNLPLNSLSFGQTSLGILREIYKRGLAPCLFNIGNVDISAQKADNDFGLWLQSCINKALKVHNRDNPTIKLWHTNQSLDGFSKKNALLTFFECDQLTDSEINILNNQNAVLVSSNYTKETFETYGVKNVKYCPLGFDAYNYRKLNRPYLGQDVISWSLSSKLELRKKTLKIIQLWVKRFGNDKKHQLNCLIFNPFMRPEDQQAMINQALGNQRIWNINFHPFQQTNELVNDFMNAQQIDLSGLSGLEGFNLPLLNFLCLGKWAVVLDAHVHKDYCDAENSILIQPSGMEVAHDGIFFHKGSPFNQGNWFSCSDEAIIDGMERAALKAHTPNPAGEALKDKFTYKNTVDIILESLNGL